MEAGQIAGLNVLRIINEPTSAALAYYLHHDRGATILVFDLGGGTFDVSLLEVGDRVVMVRATSGDNQLGGDDWDKRIVDWLVKDFKNNYGIDLSEDKPALQRLREAAENTKIELSSSTESQIHLPYIAVSEHGPLHLDARLSRAEFQQMTADLLDRCRLPFQQVLKDAAVGLSDIGHVVMVGGSTRMPAVADLVKSLTGGKKPNRSVHPDEVVAVGACLQAGVLKGQLKDILLLDVTPLSLGIETKDYIVNRAPVLGGTTVRPEARLTNFARLIERNSRIPVEAVAGLHHRRGQPAVGAHPGLPGRRRDHSVEQEARHVRAGRHRPCAPQRAADRCHLRYRRQRHPRRLREKPRDRQAAVSDYLRRLRAVRERHRADDRRRGEIC